MDLHFAMVLLFDGQRAHQADDDDAPDEGWDPRPTTRARAANLVCVWVDPFWTGLTCTSVGAPVQYGDREGEGGPVGVVFRVRGTLHPVPPSTTQRLLQQQQPPPPQPALTMCNSVKLHFFHTSREPGPGNETRRDFLYAAAFPLAALLGPMRVVRSSASTTTTTGAQLQLLPFDLSSHQAAPPVPFQAFGVFNYNRADSSAAPIGCMRLMLRPLLLRTPPTRIPPGVVLLALKGPGDDEHARALRFSQWVTDTIHTLCPTATSTFCNMRTFARDRCNTCLFQDLHALFETPWTCLPPTLALYALCGALMCNGGLTPADLTDRLIPGLRLATPEGGILRAVFMRVVRDTVACFTLCRVEGVYWADTSLGKPVEDQPFPLSFMPAERVFAKDDCEGRASQVQQLRLLLQCMHTLVAAYATDGAHHRLLQALQPLPSFKTLLGGLSDATVLGLLQGCCAIGELLLQGHLDVQTSVGDVHFGSLGEAAQAAVVGHSFALVLWRHGAIRDALVVETTGWERTEIPGFDPPFTPEEHRIYQSIPDVFAPFAARNGGILPSVCGFMPRAKENRMYERVLLGHGRMYFTLLPRPPKTKSSKPPRTEYGAHMDPIRRTLAHWPVEAAVDAFYVTTRDFVAALCDDAAAPRLWPPVAGAKQMLVDYDAMQRTLVEARRCLRPPPKAQEEVEGLMCARWAPLREDDVRAWSGGGTGGVYFSVPCTARNLTQAQVVAALHARWPTARILSYPFMCSRIFNVRCGAPQ
jgi:hypothetical protein